MLRPRAPCATALVLGLLLGGGCAHAELARAPAKEVVPYSAWRVSSGKLEPSLDGTLLIRDGSVRAESNSRAQAATLEFVYLGPATRPEPLASGELRRQIGLKLRARDTCNVVYVMWHIEPTPGIEVSVKHNPGLHLHSSCHDHGYTFVVPERVKPVALVQANTWRTLSVRLRGRMLDVSVDGESAWRGTLPSAALAFDGPLGIRSDNGRFRLRFTSQ